MADEPDDLLAGVQKDVLADIGWQLSKEQVGSAPSDLNELIGLARKWFVGEYQDIKKRICPHHDRIKQLLASDTSQAIQAMGDLALGAAGIVSPITVGRLCVQIGIDNLCKK